MQQSNTKHEASGEPEVDVVHDVAYGIEQFPADDLYTLRHDLLQANVDSFQAAEIVTTFLSGRGYGISKNEASDVARFVESAGFTVENLQAKLESVARSA